MSMKLKVLGLGLLAMMATSAFAAMNAGATVSGHFTTGSEHTYITGTEEGAEHNLHFISESGASEIGCDDSEYTGTHKSATKTTTELTITPDWEECYTTPNEGDPMEDTWGVHENGCDLRFTSRALPEANDATVHVVCAPEKAIDITHPNCTITVGSQTVGGLANDGVTYTNKNDGTPWVTMDVDVTLKSQYHGGICIFLGTNHTSTMLGEVTVTGYSDAGHLNRTAISAT